MKLSVVWECKGIYLYQTKQPINSSCTHLIGFIYIHLHRQSSYLNVFKQFFPLLLKTWFQCLLKLKKKNPNSVLELSTPSHGLHLQLELAHYYIHLWRVHWLNEKRWSAQMHCEDRRSRKRKYKEWNLLFLLALFGDRSDDRSSRWRRLNTSCLTQKHTCGALSLLCFGAAARR